MRSVWLCSVVSVLLTTAGCGGFFVVDDDPIATFKGTNRMEEPSYLTVKLDLKNRSAFTSDLVKGNLSSDVAQVAVTAAFDHPELGVNAIPLLLMDLKTGTIRETRGAALISKLAIDPDQRGNVFIKIEIKAIRTSGAEMALKIFDFVDGILNSTPFLSPEAKGVVGGLRSAAGALHELSVREYNYEVNRPIPAREEFSVDRYAQALLVLPTDDDGRLVTSAERERKKLQGSLELEARNGSNVAVLAGEPYENLPYLLIEYELSKHVVIPVLMSQQIGSSCSEVTSDRVEQARRYLAGAHTLSEQQRMNELGLVARGSVLVDLRNALDTNNEVLIVDAFSHLPPSENSAYHREYFQDRNDRIDNCIQLLVSRLPSSDLIFRLARTMVDEVEPGAKADDMEKAIEELAIFDELATAHKEFEYLLRTKLFQRAMARRTLLERTLERNRYRPLVQKLKDEATASPAADKLNEYLVKTSCKFCRDQSSKALAHFQNSKAQLDRNAAMAEATELLIDIQAAEQVLQARQNEAGIAELKQQNDRLNQARENVLKSTNPRAAIQQLEQVVGDVRTKALGAL